MTRCSSSPRTSATRPRRPGSPSTSGGRDTENGTLKEVFACGTAAVITPVGLVKSAGGDWKQSGGEPGEVTMRLRKALLDIQTGKAEDVHGWTHQLG